MIFLDTNAVIYLYSGHRDFSARVTKLINESDCFISPLVKLELQYLHEIGRGKKKAQTIIDALSHEIGLGIHDYSLEAIISAATEMSWTRDPFDRLITAHAKATNCHLVTSDKIIQKHYTKAVW